MYGCVSMYVCVCMYVYHVCVCNLTACLSCHSVNTVCWYCLFIYAILVHVFGVDSQSIWTLVVYNICEILLQEELSVWTKSYFLDHLQITLHSCFIAFNYCSFHHWFCKYFACVFTKHHSFFGKLLFIFLSLLCIWDRLLASPVAWSLRADY